MLPFFSFTSSRLSRSWSAVVAFALLSRSRCCSSISFLSSTVPALDGPAVCRLFGKAISGNTALPHRLSSDHDPLFEFRQWKANLRILDVAEVKTVPYVPLSHPFVERLIGTIRRELLDQSPFWTASDLERKLECFRNYYNQERIHASLDGITPDSKTGAPSPAPLSLARFRWKSHCRGLYQLPAAA